MALHHTHDGSFRCSKSNTHSYYTYNFESANKKPSFIQGSSVFPDVILSCCIKVIIATKKKQ